MSHVAPETVSHGGEAVSGDCSTSADGLLLFLFTYPRMFFLLCLDLIYEAIQMP